MPTRFLTGTWLCLVLWVVCCSAHSTLPGKLHRIDHVQFPQISILPRSQSSSFHKRRQTSPNPHFKPTLGTLEHDDAFRLSFNAFNTTFRLHMIPNLDLIHPNATQSTHNENGTVIVHRIKHDDFRIYRGVIIGEEYSHRRLLEDEVGVDRVWEHLEHEILQEGNGVLGWARLIVHQKESVEASMPVFEGAFSLWNDIYHIKTSELYEKTRRVDDPDHHHSSFSNVINSTIVNPRHRMVIYRDSDVEFEATPLLSKRDPFAVDAPMISNPSCGADDLLFNMDSQNPARRLRRERLRANYLPFGVDRFGHDIMDVSAPGRFFKRQSTPVNFANTKDCPKSRLINYMGAAADCTYVQYYGSAANARIQIINDWNTASGVYEQTFNISLGLITLNIMSDVCPSPVNTSLPWNQNCSADYTIDLRLSDFSEWRGGLGDDGTGLWHLMTQCITGVKVGIAWLGQLCQTTATLQQASDGSQEWVSGTGISSINRDEWKVVAHEVGHGFGAIHDCTAQTCPCVGDCGCCPLNTTVCDAGGTYLMNPTSNVTTNQFSPCSITDICNAYPNIGYCLQKPGSRQTETLSMCGNGILEPGEECDSGGVDDACCYGKTCKLKPGAVCDDYNDGCCTNCTVAPKNYVCRPSISSCDPQEVCDGTSLQCPPDVWSPDGSSCGNGLQCASGQCTSRDLQCQIRGGKLNITQACSFSTSNSCQLGCADPSNPSNCIMLSGSFIDGTTCGYGGNCYQGNCQSGGALATMDAWIAQNKQYSIPIILAFCLLVILLILRIGYGWRNAIRRRRLLEKKKAARDSADSQAQRRDSAHSRNGVSGWMSTLQPITDEDDGSEVMDMDPMHRSTSVRSTGTVEHHSDHSRLSRQPSDYTRNHQYDNSPLSRIVTEPIPAHSPPAHIGIHMGYQPSPPTPGTSFPEEAAASSWQLHRLPSTTRSHIPPIPSRRNHTGVYGGSDTSDHQWLGNPGTPRDTSPRFGRSILMDTIRREEDGL
ncbi:hypothetical protein BZG36_00797 [Bifiguratus adelaidae]|uniref:Disintegrin and metalloproteinase domain-containing protein B n=1 Tax=Bifiguratus adelaidae TaxID=1938954 RepID=A0A261Y6Z7_9FUNG|nr:hypothetical protein BZG36_00797 [Bifiguratus adelaidae]